MNAKKSEGTRDLAVQPGARQPLVPLVHAWIAAARR